MAGIEQLTDTKIRSLTLKGNGFHADGGNLYLRIRGSGRTWVFRFKVRLKAEWASADEFGKAIEIGLGTYPALSLAAARLKVAPYREALASGTDPREVGKSDEKAQRTFEHYATAYIANAKGGWKNKKHIQQWGNTLRDWVYPTLGKKAARNIKRDDVEAALRPLWEAGKFETFSRVRMRIEKILAYAYHDLEIDRANPARWQDNLKIRFGDISPKRAAKVAGKLKSHAAPDWRTCPAIMANLRAKPEVMSALALRFSILTAARSTEVRAMVWDEVDTEGAVWRLPADRVKNEEAHAIPLNEEALEVLKLAKAKAGESERVFPGPNGGLLSDVAVTKQLDAAIGYKHEPGGDRPATAHGIARSSFRDWCADATTFPDKWAEAALNHKNPNETEASYLRTKFFQQRIQLMKAWGEFLAGKDNVIELKPTSKLA